MGHFPALLERLSENHRDEILERAWRRHASRKEIITVQGEPIDKIYLIASGRVRTYYAYADGRTLTFAHWTDGMLMGLLGMSDWGQRYHWSSEAVRATELLCFKRTDFVAMIRNMPEATHCMVELMEFKSEYLARLVRLMATHSVLERVSLALLNLSQFFGRSTSSGIVIDERFTHEEIADMVGASRQWVTTTLNELERDGLIEVVGQRIVLKSLDVLLAHSGIQAGA